MASILGLTSGKTFADNNSFYSLNDRRRVFRAFPNGGAPLTGLLSLMDTEPTDNPHFGWWEKRFEDIKTELDGVDWGSGTQGPFSTAEAGTVGLGGTITFTADASYNVCVASTSGFKQFHVVWIMQVPTGNTTFKQIKAVVTSITSSTVMVVRVLETVTGILVSTNTTTSGTKGPIDAVVQVIGTANPEGGTSGNHRWVAPINPSNYSQIFRTAFNFTSTSLKIPASFDKTGLYREKAKDAALDHMLEIERACLWGTKSVLGTYALVSTDQVPQRTMGGLLWFLEQWEAASGGEPSYRTGSALTSDTDENKRIIENPTGTITYANWQDCIRRAFKRCNNRSYEKLALCGSGALQALNNLIETGIVTVNKGMKAEDTYGMNVKSVDTLHGTLHFKTHPLFNEDPFLQYAIFIIDVGNLKLRPLNDRDTVLLKNRQANDEDGRKDEWLSELGLEVRFPESHMLIKNVQIISAPA